jgi:hypothetical protein
MDGRLETNADLTVLASSNNRKLMLLTRFLRSYIFSEKVSEISQIFLTLHLKPIEKDTTIAKNVSLYPIRYLTQIQINKMFSG